MNVEVIVFAYFICLYIITITRSTYENEQSRLTDIKYWRIQTLSQWKVTRWLSEIMIFRVNICYCHFILIVVLINFILIVVLIIDYSCDSECLSISIISDKLFWLRQWWFVVLLIIWLILLCVIIIWWIFPYFLHLGIIFK